MNPLRRSLAVLALTLGALPVAALGHSFQLGVIVPLSGPDSARGAEALDGLRLATRERDSHPNETSDGHLGGLDSHLVPIDSTLVERPEDLRAALTEQPLDIVTIVYRPADAGTITNILSEPGMPVSCPPADGPVPADKTASAEADEFRQAFQAEFGYAATGAAAIGYNAGRAVDAAVRPLNSVDDRAALKRLCNGG